MPTLRLGVKLPKEPTKSEAVASPEPQPGLLKRILHRAVSKTNLRSPSHATPSSQALPEADVAPPRRHGQGETTRHAPPKPSFRRLRSKTDLRSESEVAPPRVRTLEAYVPRHAACDFNRTAYSKDGSTRFHSFDEDWPRIVWDSPPTDRPGTSPGLLLATLPPRDRSSRPDGAQTDTPPTVARRDDDETACRIAPLPPPTAVPAKRHGTRHSYKLASDPFEAPPELSDYEKFIQKAVEEDRQHCEELWRTISERSLRGRDVVFPNRLDLGASHAGGKRNSIFSYRPHADRQEKREPPPGPPKQVGKRPSNRSLRRLHDYFKPQATAQSPECR